MTLPSMSRIKKTALLVAAAVASLVIGILIALSGILRARAMKRVSVMAEDLARQNASRARAQAEMESRALDSEADESIAKADAEANKGSTDAASSGNLADFLNDRTDSLR